jgi:hypothetical protein
VFSSTNFLFTTRVIAKAFSLYKQPTKEKEEIPNNPQRKRRRNEMKN